MKKEIRKFIKTFFEAVFCGLDDPIYSASLVPIKGYVCVRCGKTHGTLLSLRGESTMPRIPLLVANRPNVNNVSYSLEALLDIAQKNPERFYVEDGALYIYPQAEKTITSRLFSMSYKEMRDENPTADR